MKIMAKLFFVMEDKLWWLKLGKEFLNLTLIASKRETKIIKKKVMITISKQLGFSTTNSNKSIQFWWNKLKSPVNLRMKAKKESTAYFLAMKTRQPFKIKNSSFSSEEHTKAKSAYNYFPMTCIEIKTLKLRIMLKI